MKQVKIGTRVNRLGISRVQVGDGMVSRAILLDDNPQVKFVAYDETLKKKVEVDQDMCIKYGLRPATTFYYLVAKLNTDLQGNVIGDKFTVEYLQLSENLNNQFSDLVAEQGIPTSLHLSKVKKTGEGGRDYSYIKVVPSNRDFSDNPLLLKKIEEFKSNKDFIDKCWMMIDAETSITKQQYEALLGSNSAETLPSVETPSRPQVTSDVTHQPQRQLPQSESSSNDFGGSNDFSDISTDFEDLNDF